MIGLGSDKNTAVQIIKIAFNTGFCTVVFFIWNRRAFSYYLWSVPKAQDRNKYVKKTIKTSRFWPLY